MEPSESLAPTNLSAEEPLRIQPPAQPHPSLLIPASLFVATCLSTLLVNGPAYAVALMAILTAHELGHYFQARRYRVPASLPYFIPMPFTVIGTMGAIIAMRSRIADSRALFDIAVTGPLAGLVPSLILSTVGLRMSTIVPSAVAEGEGMVSLGEPLIFKALTYLTLGSLPEGHDVTLHPVAFAGWVGIFITALNLLPIGQLDGGHILYALLRRRAHLVSITLLALAIATVIAGGFWQYSVLIVILLLIGIRHPPTSPYSLPLDSGRKALGWLTLSFLIFGLTPTPFQF